MTIVPEVPSERSETPISVERLHVPLPAMLGLFAVLLGGVISVAGVWYQTRSHAVDEVIHASPQDARVGGGVAYKADVRALKESVEQKFAEEGKKTRRMLRGMTIRCQKVGSGFACQTTLPEIE